mgnify:CR=1 FL=1
MKLPLQVEEQIVQLTIAGKTIAEIVSLVNRPPSTINNVRNRHGLITTPTVLRTNLSSAEVEEAVATYKEGRTTLRAMSERYGVGIRALRHALVKRGVPINIRGHNMSPPSEAAISKARDLIVNSNKTRNEVAAECGLSRKVLSRVAKGLVRLNPPSHPNPMTGRHFYTIWVERYGEEEALRRMAVSKKKWSKSCSGNLNAMYGRPSPQGAGNGWKGWYQGHYFRSFRELTFMLECDSQETKWETGESVSIPYRVGEIDRTYRPDFRVDDRLIELKPERLIGSPAVAAKTTAGQAYCQANGLRYEIFDPGINLELIQNAYEAGLIRFTRDYEARFLGWLKNSSPT